MSFAWCWVLTIIVNKQQTTTNNNNNNSKQKGTTSGRLCLFLLVFFWLGSQKLFSCFLGVSNHKNSDVWEDALCLALSRVLFLEIENEGTILGRFDFRCFELYLCLHRQLFTLTPGDAHQFKGRILALRALGLGCFGGGLLIRLTICALWVGLVVGLTGNERMNPTWALSVSFGMSQQLIMGVLLLWLRSILFFKHVFAVFLRSLSRSVPLSIDCRTLRTAALCSSIQVRFFFTLYLPLPPFTLEFWVLICDFLVFTLTWKKNAA